MPAAGDFHGRLNGEGRRHQVDLDQYLRNRLPNNYAGTVIVEEVVNAGGAASTSSTRRGRRIEPLIEVLGPYLRVVFRIAARSHYLREKPSR